MNRSLPTLGRGLVLSSLALAACSGTRTTGETESFPDPASGELASLDASANAGALPAPTGLFVDAQGQDPGQGVKEQRQRTLIDTSLANARRAMELKLWKEVLRETAFVLELDPNNEEARTLLLGAQDALGDQPAQLTRQFQDRVTAARISLERDRFQARQEMQLAEALEEQGRWGDAIERYERAILILKFNPLSQPGDTLMRELERKLEIAQQSQAQAMQDALAARRAASQAQLEEAERRDRLARERRVSNLLESANKDFQLGNFRSSVKLLDQALHLDPINENALALRDLAGRAQHETRLEVLRQRWKAEWSKTFDELNSIHIPQTEILKFDLARWAEVSEREPLQFTAPEALDSPEERAIRAKLDETTLEHRFASATVDDWSKYYQSVTDVNFLIASEVRDLDEESTTLTDFNLPPMSVTKALNVIGAQTGIKWRVRDGVVELVTAETATGKTYLLPYEVRDLVLGVTNKPGPDLKLTVPGEEDDFGGDDEEPAPTVVDDGKLQDLIRNNIAPETWDETGTISYQNGALLVRHTREIHEQIAQLLSDLRQAVGVQVDVEARFLKVEDSFLEDIGVDFRGLGNQSSEGVPGRGLEENNRSNVRFDDFGRPETINPAQPGEIGTSTEPGVFFDDGGDGDLLGRTEHLYDAELGGGENGLDNGGGLSLQYAFLDDIELEVVLRAVAKQQRSEEIVAPRILVYNNTRASMQALRHTSYIRDFDVEIAQAAAVANPVVDVVKDGVVLDVRPVVSADRRFITMELRPTVMTLTLPIPTFTTTLGAGQPVSIQLPEVTLQRVRTTVTMPDGGTVMLGGQKLAERQQQTSGVPILKDLPGLSFLFSRKGSYIQNRKILILIRASIIMSEEHEPLLPADAFDTLLGTR